MGAAYRERLAGANNPHFSAAGAKVCVTCGGGYIGYNNSRKFCSVGCYAASKPRAPKRQLVLKLVKPAPIPREKRRPIDHVCLQCGVQFTGPAKRKFCSYGCHIKSGGAFRAGLASARAVMKYGAKKDANHREVIEEMRKHCAVYDLSAQGCGLPDGLAWIGDQWRLFDVKNPKTAYGRRGLNQVQKKWIQQWNGGPVYLIYTVDEACRFACGNFDGIKRVESAGSLKAAA
jgi:hypothetical protein